MNTNTDTKDTDTDNGQPEHLIVRKLLELIQTYLDNGAIAIDDNVTVNVFVPDAPDVVQVCRATMVAADPKNGVILYAAAGFIETDDLTGRLFGTQRIIGPSDD